jgi:hypothetical protein
VAHHVRSKLADDYVQASKVAFAQSALAAKVNGHPSRANNVRITR